MADRNIDINPFKKVRVSLNRSIKDLSKILGLSYMTLDQAEKGLIKRPFRYARALERDGLIERADVMLAEQGKWLFRIRQKNLQRLKEDLKK